MDIEIQPLPCRLQRPTRRPSGFTLVELLVALVLSALILQLLVPLLSHVRDSISSVNDGDFASVPTWQAAIRMDVACLVSQTKCGVPVVRIQNESPQNAFPELRLQTLSRPDARSRGPSEVRYVVEAAGEADKGQTGLVLVRYARGWHDGIQTRHVLLEDVTTLRLEFPVTEDTALVSAGGSDGPNTTAATAPVVDTETCVLRMTIGRGSDEVKREHSADFWIAAEVVTR